MLMWKPIKNKNIQFYSKINKEAKQIVNDCEIAHRIDDCVGKVDAFKYC